MFWQDSEPPATLMTTLEELLKPARIPNVTEVFPRRLQHQIVDSLPLPTRQEIPLPLSPTPIVDHGTRRRGITSLGIAAAIVGGLAAFEVASQSKHISEGIIVGTAVGLFAAGLFLRRSRSQAGMSLA